MATTRHDTVVTRWALDHPVHDLARQKRKRRSCGQGAHGRRIFDRARVEVRPWPPRPPALGFCPPQRRQAPGGLPLHRLLPGRDHPRRPDSHRGQPVGRGGMCPDREAGMRPGRPSGPPPPRPAPPHDPGHGRPRLPDRPACPRPCPSAHSTPTKQKRRDPLRRPCPRARRRPAHVRVGAPDRRVRAGRRDRAASLPAVVALALGARRMAARHAHRRPHGGRASVDASGRGRPHRLGARTTR